MSEGIQFLIDIQERLEGAVAASAALKSVYENAEKADHGVSHMEGAMHKATSASHAAAGAHEKHGHSIWQLGHQYEYAKNGVMEFTEAIGLVLAFEAVEKLVDVVKELGAEILHAAAGAERARTSFEIAFGRPEGDELLEYIEEIGKFTEFTQVQLKGFASELAQGGFNVEKLPRALAASLDIAARSPDKIAGIGKAISALSTIQTTGRVDARMFRRLGIGEENAPEKFYAELSKRTGKGVDLLKKEMDKGKVPVEDSIEALYTIIAGSRGKLGAAGVEMGKGMEAKITHFKEIPDLIFESVEKSPAFGRFASFIEEMTDKLGPKGPLGDKLAKGLGAAFDSIADRLSKITPDDITGFVDALAAMPGVIADLTKSLVQILPYVSKFAGAMAQLSDSGSAISRVYQIGKAVVSPAGFAADQLKKAYDKPGAKDNYYVKGFVTGLMDIATLGHLTDRMGVTGETVGSSLAKGIKAATPWVKDAGGGMADAADDGTREKAQIHSPSRRFMELGRLSALGYATGLESGMDDAMEIPAPSVGARGAFGGMAGGRGQGDVAVSAPVTITVTSGDATAEQIAEAIRIEVPSAILSALEQAGLEMGAS